MQLYPPIVPPFHVLFSCLSGGWPAQHRSTETFTLNSETNCHHSLLVAGGILHWGTSAPEQVDAVKNIQKGGILHLVHKFCYSAY